MYNDLSLMIGGGGTDFIDSAATSKTYAFLVVNANTVLTTLTGVSGTNGITALGLSGKTINQGMIIRLPGGELISAVTPASGSVIGVRSGAQN